MLEEKIYEILNRVDQSELIIPNKGLEEAGHRSYLTKSCKSVTVDGLWLEFGVFRGRTICNISDCTDKIVYGFDSFEGLHENWNYDNPKGIYTLHGKIPEGAICGEDWEVPYKMKPWPENVVLIQGYFDDTLPNFLSENSEKVAFCHIDSDLYSSCKTIFNLLKDRIVAGTIIAFDELIGYNNFMEHEIKAFAEFLLETNFDYDVLYYQNPNDYGQVCVKIKNK